jgi:NAD(P)-dependent dehydrogenase (short-subunit alcohol dehydrogenase family)
MTKTVLITGASTGIGYATGQFLAAQGWRVLAGARKQEDIDRLSNENGVIGFALDVTNDEQVKTLGDILSRECPSGLDGLINNAGIAVTGPWEFVGPEDLRRQFDVNFIGLVDITRVALPFVRRAGGRVVNISSIAGLIADAFLGPVWPKYSNLLSHESFRFARCSAQSFDWSPIALRIPTPFV